MSNTQLPPEHAKPSEEELRQMLEARELEKETARKQLSHRFTKILVVATIILIGAILCFPSSRKAIDGASHENPRVAELKAAILSQQNPAASKVPDELKPFSVKPGENSDRDNIRFGMELLNFLQPPTRPPATPPSSGASQPVKKP